MCRQQAGAEHKPHDGLHSLSMVAGARLSSVRLSSPFASIHAKAVSGPPLAGSHHWPVRTLCTMTARSSPVTASAHYRASGCRASADPAMWPTCLAHSLIYPAYGPRQLLNNTALDRLPRLAPGPILIPPLLLCSPTIPALLGFVARGVPHLRDRIVAGWPPSPCAARLRRSSWSSGDRPLRSDVASLSHAPLSGSAFGRFDLSPKGRPRPLSKVRRLMAAKAVACPVPPPSMIRAAI
jgi:hypothetical protein